MIRPLNEKVFKHNFQFPKYHVLAWVLHGLFVALFYSVVSSSDSEVTKETIATPARLNVFVATTITSFRVDRLEKVGGYRLKMNIETYSGFFLVVFTQPTL